jgi:Mg2+ transporter MgtE
LTDERLSANTPEKSEVSSSLLAKVISTVDLAPPETTPDLQFIAQENNSCIAHLLESLSDTYRSKISTFIPSERIWPILHLLQYETARHIVDKLNESQFAELLELAVERDILTFAELLPQELVDEFLVQQEAETNEQLQTALGYHDEEVGRYLNYDILKVRPSASIGRTLQRINSAKPRRFVAVYVVDAEGHFHGGCTMGQLLSASPEQKVASLCVALPPLSDRQVIGDAARMFNPIEGFAWHPVEKEGKVIGAFAIALLMQRLRDKSLEVLASETAQNEEDLFTPVPVAARMRAIWLTANLLTAFLASAVIALFENTVQQVVSLAILMPVVASMGGIAGSQTLAVALRGIALNHLKRSNLRLLLDKELKIAAFNGVALGLLIGVVVWYWFNSFALGVIILVAIVCNGLAAASSGTVIPFLLKQLKIDPAVAGSVILTTVTDVVGFIIFLGLGSLILTTA